MWLSTASLVAVLTLLGCFKRALPGDSEMGPGIGSQASALEGGNGNSYGGGDPVVEDSLEVARQTLIGALKRIADDYDTAFLCTNNRCTATDPACVVLNKLTDPQRASCRTFLGFATPTPPSPTTAEQMWDLNMNTPRTPFTVTGETLKRSSDNQTVPAKTMVGAGRPDPWTKEGAEILFNYSSILGTIQGASSHRFLLQQLVALLGHELGHRVLAPAAFTDNKVAAYLDDGDPVKAFPGGAREAFDAVGWSLAWYAVTHNAYRETVLNDEPLAYYRLGEQGDDDRNAYDSSGNGFRGTYSSNVKTGARGALAGDVDTAAKFTNTTNVDSQGNFTFSSESTMEAKLSSVGNGPRLNVGNDTVVSVEAWFRWNGTVPNPTEGMMIVGFENGAGLILSQGGNSRLSIRCASDNANARLYLDEPRATFENQWAHVVAVIRNNDLKTSKLYLNGEDRTASLVKDTGFANGTNVTTRIHVSGSGEGRRFRFNGAIDEVAFYNRELTAAQVQAHYRAGMGL